MKLLIKILVFLLLLFLIAFLIIKNTVLYSYINPYTETSGFNNISKSVKTVQNVLYETKSSLKDDGIKIKFLYFNPYGSGFLKNNSIPNDLDFAVGIDIGEYEYDGKNAEEIAVKMVNIIKAFDYNLALNFNLHPELFSAYSPMGTLQRLNYYEKTNILDITSAINNVVNGESYVKSTIFDNIEGGHLIQMPYIMNSNEILLQELKPFILYSDDISYNNSSLPYLRELSLVPEFFAKIHYNNKTINVELVPEAFKGVRLQLSRRCFASTVFSGFNSIVYLKSVDWFVNNDKYIKYRLLSYKRHLQEINNLDNNKKSPVKILKRMMQTAEIIHPLLSDEEYNDVALFVSSNLNKPEIRLFNDYLTIYSNVLNIYRAQNITRNLSVTPKLQYMEKTCENIVSELEQNQNIDKNVIIGMKNLNKKFQNNLSSKQKVGLKDDFDNLEKDIIKVMYKQLTTPEKIKNFVGLNNKIMSTSGYHEVTMYWLNDKEIGILKDNFTKQIKDFDEFIAANNLPKIKYKLVTNNQLPKIPLKFKIYVCKDSTGENLLEQAFLDDKSNFKIKYGLGIVK